jgi:hypothetical protein
LLFFLKNNKSVAKLHLVNHWTDIPDVEIELEEYDRQGIDIND